MSGSENFLKASQLYFPGMEPERGRGKEEVEVVAQVPSLEVGRIKGKFTVSKYRVELEEYLEKYGSDEGVVRFHAENKPYETIVAENVLCTSGLNFLLKCLVGQGVAPESSGTVVQRALNTLTRYSACIGVGDGGGSLPSVSASDTDLAASSNYNYVNATGNPSVTTNQITVSCTFGSALGNYHWRELAVSNAASSVIANPYAQFSQGLGQSITAKISSNPGTANYSLISHLASDLGVKSTGSSWSCSWVCTIS